MKFLSAIQNHLSTLKEEKSALPDAAQPEDAVPQNSAPNTDSADTTVQEPQSTLDENEKLLIDILLKIASVIKDLEIAQHTDAHTSDNPSLKLDGLINDTRKGLMTAPDVNTVLRKFLNGFEDIYRDHLTSIGN